MTTEERLPNVGHLCKQFRGKPCSDCRRLIHLEQKVSDAEEVLRLAREERRMCYNLVNAQHDPLVSRLPVELVSRIFVWCLPRQASLKVFSVCDHADYRNWNVPIILGSVCQEWRRIAFSTPQIWNIISFDFYSLIFPYQDLMWKTWLDRSACLPLYIRLASSADWQIHQPSQFRESETIAYFNSARDRWRVLESYIPFAFLELLRGNENSPEMSLDRLSLDGGGIIEPPLFTTQSKPRQLVLFKSGSFLPSTSGIELCNLAKFEGYHIPAGVAAAILRHAPRLENCTLGSLYRNEDTSFTYVTPLTHHALRRFELNAVESSEFFLDHLALPSLVELIYDLDDSSLPHCYEFVGRSDCRLTSMTIENVDEVDDELYELLYGAPLLTSLSISFFPSGHQSFDFDFRGNSVNGPSNNPFLPHLLNFHLRILRNFHISAFALSWSSETANLPEIDIVLELDGNPHIIGKDTLDNILEAKRRGVNFQVRDEHGCDLVSRSQSHHMENA